MGRKRHGTSFHDRALQAPPQLSKPQDICQAKWGPNQTSHSHAGPPHPSLPRQLRAIFHGFQLCLARMAKGKNAPDEFAAALSPPSSGHCSARHHSFCPKHEQGLLSLSSGSGRKPLATSGSLQTPRAYHPHEPSTAPPPSWDLRGHRESAP